VVESDFLAVTGARATCERGANTVDLVWIGLFTPSRVPLAGSRWAPPPPPGLDLAPPGASLPVVDTGSDFPARGQAGIRWNRIASGFEYSLSLFDGYNHLPRLEAVPKPDLGRIEAHRVYPPMRMAGGDFAWPVRWFTLKGEAAYFWTTDPLADDYGLYVIQVERQHGEWLFVGGYAGEFVSADRGLAATPVFAFDRGLARTFLGRASVTLDGLRSVALEGALRDNGAGGWLMAEYSRAIGQHWRATARGDLVRGAPDDFFGRYRRNSGVRLSLRYSY
jgi:hypothetical protein